MLNNILLVIAVLILIVDTASLVILILNRMQEEKDYRVFDQLQTYKEDNSNLWDYTDYLMALIDAHNDKVEEEEKGDTIDFYSYHRWMDKRLQASDEPERNSSTF